MKIAFVNELFERFGVEHVSALLKANGHQTKLFIDPRLFDDGECSAHGLANIFNCRKRLISELKTYQPDIIGFSIATDSYQWALGMTRMIKEAMDVPIIMGGIHPTSVPERVISNESVDMVCVGEGEYAMLELVNSMAKGQIDTTIRNIWFKRNGDIIRNEVRPLIEDLDALPMPDKELFYSASPHFSECYFIMTSRGCVNSCSYCCHSYLRKIYSNKGRYLRQRSMDNIIEELVGAKKKYNVKIVRFWDDDFIVDRNSVWFQEFASKYKKSVGLPFICYLYPKDVSEEAIEYLKDAGCCEVNIGVQSWNDDLRRNILHRDTPNWGIDKVLDMLKKNKINAIIDFICGMPHQIDDDVINFLKHVGRTRWGEVNFFGIQYFPNVGMTLMMKEKGCFSASKYDEILDGRNPHLTHLGGDIAFKEIVKYKIIVLIIKAFPQSVAEHFIEKKVYKLIARVLPCWLLEKIYNFFMRNYDQKHFSRAKRRHYLYFISKMIRPF